MALVDYYNTGRDSSYEVYVSYARYAQTFTASKNYLIGSIKLQLSRGYGYYPGNVTFSVKATDVNGKPTGSNLASGVLNGNLFSTSWTWVEAIFGTPYQLVSGTKYAIVIIPSADSIYWAIDITSPSYAGGTAFWTGNNGVTWTAQSTVDCMFETYEYEEPEEFLLSGTLTNPVDTFTGRLYEYPFRNVENNGHWKAGGTYTFEVSTKFTAEYEYPTLSTDVLEWTGNWINTWVYAIIYIGGSWIDGKWYYTSITGMSNYFWYAGSESNYEISPIQRVHSVTWGLDVLTGVYTAKGGRDGFLVRSYLPNRKPASYWVASVKEYAVINPGACVQSGDLYGKRYKVVSNTDILTGTCGEDVDFPGAGGILFNNEEEDQTGSILNGLEVLSIETMEDGWQKYTVRVYDTLAGGNYFIKAKTVLAEYDELEAQ